MMASCLWSSLPLFDYLPALSLLNVQCQLKWFFLLLGSVISTFQTAVAHFIGLMLLELILLVVSHLLTLF